MAETNTTVTLKDKTTSGINVTLVNGPSWSQLTLDDGYDIAELRFTSYEDALAVFNVIKPLDTFTVY